MKLYLVSRADLHPGVRASQLCHSLREVARAFPDLDQDWYEKSNTLVLLEVGSERELAEIASAAQACGIRGVEWREPDLSNALTAVAFGPEAKRLCRPLRLAFA